MSQKGYFLIEALMAMLLLSVTMAALIGSVGQALKISKRQTELREHLLKVEALFLDLESGLRPDLVRYGGREYGFEIRNKESDEKFALLDAGEFMALLPEGSLA